MISCCRLAIVTGMAPRMAKAFWRRVAFISARWKWTPAYAAARAGLAMTYIAEVAQGMGGQTDDGRTGDRSE